MTALLLVALVLSLCANAALGALLYSTRDTLRHWMHRAEHAMKADEVSRERLYAAWKSGAEIPTAAAVAPVPFVDEAPLSDALLAHVLDWEDERAQGQQLRFIRSRLASGKSEADVLRELRPAA